MGQEYLPGDTPQQRLQDLMKEYKITQAELASKIGVAESSISRFLNGTKNKLTIEQIIRIARIFNVSSDFLLCLTNVPDKKNYDISELGLSTEAARNLYTGRVNPEVVSRLLENRRFAQLTSMIALYFDETMASGFAAQNNLLRLMEGGIITHDEGTKSYSMDTSGLLFICLGAFDGITDLVRKRLGASRRIGFGEDPGSGLSEA